MRNVNNLIAMKRAEHFALIVTRNGIKESSEDNVALKEELAKGKGMWTLEEVNDLLIEMSATLTDSDISGNDRDNGNSITFTTAQQEKVDMLIRDAYSRAFAKAKAIYKPKKGG